MWWWWGGGIKEPSQRLMTFETFDQSDGETWHDMKNQANVFRQAWLKTCWSFRFSQILALPWFSLTPFLAVLAPAWSCDKFWQFCDVIVFRVELPGKLRADTGAGTAVVDKTYITLRAADAATSTWWPQVFSLKFSPKNSLANEICKGYWLGLLIRIIESLIKVGYPSRFKSFFSEF